MMSGHVFSQPPDAQPSPPALDKYLLTFEDITSPSSAIITSVIRDDRGFLWFGTTRGLCKYDGYQVKIYSVGNSSDPVQQIVTATIKMGDSSLLLGTGKGLWNFDLKSEQAAPLLPGTKFSVIRIEAIAEDSVGTVWIGTTAQGLLRYVRTTGELRQFTTNDGLSNNRITSLLVDRAGKLWIGTVEGGLNFFNTATSQFKNYRKDSSQRGSLKSDHIVSLCESTNRELWIGTDDGLNVLDLATERMHRLELPSPLRHTIRSIAHDQVGRMWIGASDLGLLSHFKEEFTSIPGSSGISHALNAIMTLYIDPVASHGQKLLLWVGTRIGVFKVSMFLNPFMNHIRHQHALELDRGAVLSLREDRKGMLWVGLWGGGLEGLQRVGGSYRRVSHFEHDPKNPFSLPNNDVGPMVEDQNGILWVGTGGGLAMLDARREHMVVYKHVEGDSTSLLGNDINGLYEDRSGTLWICTRGGVSKLAQGKPVHFVNFLNDPEDAHPIGGSVTTGFLEDHLSNRWVSTFGRGLLKLDASSMGLHRRGFTQFTYPLDTVGNQENWIYSFIEDHQGLFWLSTNAGLVSFNPRSGEFTKHLADQLSGVHIFGIVGDLNGELWLSTGIGLARFTPATNSFVRFDENHGLPFKELFSSFFTNSRGRLFVGGLDGFTEFSPESVSNTARVPEIAITSVSVFDKELSASAISGGEIRLSYDQNFFSFSFAALDYIDPRRNGFSYRMTGVDRHWIDAGARNYASYTNLDPGSYVFEVKGCNSENVWNTSGTSIAIIIAPPYWQTWWFRLLVAGFLGWATYAVYRYRLRRLLEVARLRLRIADDLHDDVGSNLSTIAMVSRAIQRMPELTSETRRKLVEIYDTAVATSEGMKDIVWFIKPENDTLDDLLLRMKDTASSLLGEVEHEFNVPQSENTSQITIDFKRNFYLGYKEILTNIVKHSSATKVEIRVDQRDGFVEAQIRDNGKGFDEHLVRRGNGLTSLQNRAHAIGGMCRVLSEISKGTSVTFSGRL